MDIKYNTGIFLLITYNVGGDLHIILCPGVS